MKTPYNVVLLTCFFAWMKNVCSQNLHHKSSRDLSAEDNAYNQFALELLVETTCILESKYNAMLSPFSVWSTLALVTEGSAGNTYKQLASALHLNMGSKSLRSRYEYVDNILKTNEASSVELDNANALFTDKNRPVNKDFETTVQRYYHANILPIDFQQVQQSAYKINSWVSNATRNRIPQIVNENDLIDPHLILANAIYFKGQWKYPFNRSSTTNEDFKDEDGNILGKVPMMKHLSTFVYGYINQVEAYVLVLPYVGDKFSMMLVLPQKKVPLLQVLERMKLVSLGVVYNILEQQQGAEQDEVRVIIPRFVIKSDFVLNGVLANLGITDAFSTGADFHKIAPHDVYLSKLIHKAEIEVNEEGTVASAATGASFAEKMMPSLFFANKPFAYFIVENDHKTILFAGRVSNPVTK